MRPELIRHPSGHDMDYEMAAQMAVDDDCGEVRRALYIATKGATKDQMDTLAEVLRYRRDIANLHGYSNFGDFWLQKNSQFSLGHVLKFLRSEVTRLTPLWRDELRRLGDPESVWEMERRFADRRVLLKPPQLSLDQVFDGIKRLCGDFFDLNVKFSPCQFPWARGFQKAEISDGKTNQDLGTIYVDLLARRTKKVPSCHYTIKGRKSINSTNLVYGITDAPQSATSLITSSIHNPAHVSWGDVKTILHEFGHALHNICSQSQYQAISGTRCAFEVAEVPGLFMEGLIERSEIARMYFSNHQCSANFEDLLEEERQLDLWSSFDSVQLAFADIILHSKSNHSDYCIEEVLEQVNQEMGGIFIFDKEFNWLGKMHHFGSYGCGAYIYPLAKRLASNILSVPHGISTSRSNVLNRGGLLSVDHLWAAYKMEKL
jgi:Zn-dependent oligopeptidase